MPLQIANPTVVGKVERLARVTGLNKTAAVERAVDCLLREIEAGDTAPPAKARSADRLTAILSQLDRLPDLADGTAGAVDLDWDDLGLPR